MNYKNNLQDFSDNVEINKNNNTIIDNLNSLSKNEHLDGYNKAKIQEIIYNIDIYKNIDTNEIETILKDIETYYTNIDNPDILNDDYIVDVTAEKLILTQIDTIKNTISANTKIMQEQVALLAKKEAISQSLLEQIMLMEDNPQQIPEPILQQETAILQQKQQQPEEKQEPPQLQPIQEPAQQQQPEEKQEQQQPQPNQQAPVQQQSQHKPRAQLSISNNTFNNALSTETLQTEFKKIKWRERMTNYYQKSAEMIFNTITDGLIDEQTIDENKKAETVQEIVKILKKADKELTNVSIRTDPNKQAQSIFAKICHALAVAFGIKIDISDSKKTAIVDAINQAKYLSQSNKQNKL